jgi:hypothetical protein
MLTGSSTEGGTSFGIAWPTVDRQAISTGYCLDLAAGRCRGSSRGARGAFRKRSALPARDRPRRRVGSKTGSRILARASVTRLGPPRSGVVLEILGRFFLWCAGIFRRTEESERCRRLFANCVRRSWLRLSCRFLGVLTAAWLEHIERLLALSAEERSEGRRRIREGLKVGSLDW